MSRFETLGGLDHACNALRIVALHAGLNIPNEKDFLALFTAPSCLNMRGYQAESSDARQALIQSLHRKQAIHASVKEYMECFEPPVQTHRGSYVEPLKVLKFSRDANGRVVCSSLTKKPRYRRAPVLSPPYTNLSRAASVPRVSTTLPRSSTLILQPLFHEHLMPYAIVSVSSRASTPSLTEDGSSEDSDSVQSVPNLLSSPTPSPIYAKGNEDNYMQLQLCF